jgi:2-iminobutanoate/2-iminopropanoate deaminase
MLKTKNVSRLILAMLFVMAAIYAASSSSKRKIITPKDSTPSPNYSAGIHVGDTLYVSGQTGAKGGKVPDNFEDEVRQCLENVHVILQAGGMDYADVVSVQIYLTDIDMFQRMNAVYTGIMKEPRPTRTTVGVSKLAAAGAHIEITATARK